MKKLLLFIFIASALAIGIYSYMLWREQQKPLTIWTCVPESAAIAFQIDQPQTQLSQWSKKTFWKNIAALPEPHFIQKMIGQIDSLAKAHDLKEGFFKNKSVFVSMHATGREEVGYLLCYDLAQDGSLTAWNTLLKNLQESGQYKFQDRLYQELIITDITHRNTGQKASFLIYKNVLAISQTAILVEDVIRTINHPTQVHFIDYQKKNFKPTPHENGNITAYLNYKQLPALLATLSPAQKSFFEPLARMAQSATLELNTADNRFHAEGFSLAEDNSYFLSTFAPQAAQPITVQKFIPNKTAVLYHFSFSKGAKFGSDLDGYRHRHLDEYIEAKEALHEQHNISPSQLYGWWGREIALCLLETVDADEADKLLFVQAADMEQATRTLNTFSEQFSDPKPYIEQFQGREIRQIPVTDFPALLLGNPFGGFSECFYFQIDDYIVFANNIQTLRTLIADIEREDVWAKSVKIQKFMQELNPKAHVTLAINTARAWRMLQNNAGEKFGEIMQAQQAILQKNTWLAAQFNVTETRTQTSLIVEQEADGQTSASDELFKVKYDTYFQFPVQTPPKVVRNPVDKSLETIVLDSAQQVFLLDKDGKISFKLPVNQRVVSEFLPVYLQDEAHQQFTFATDKALYLTDRTGAVQEPFPVRLADSTRIAQLAVFDYEKNHNYRFLVANTDGLLYMFDEKGKTLEGWNPRRLPSKLAAAPLHLRINDKDCIVALTAAGKLYMLTRKGELFAGFPIDLKGRFESALLPQIGTSFENTYITTLSEQGELITVSLKGKESKREQIYRPSVNTVFTLCPDPAGKAFAVARQTDTQVALFDNNLKPIFEKEYKNANRLPVQYYNFGAGNEVIAVTDPADEKTYLYDKKGQLLQGKPLDSASPVAMLYSEASETFFLYRHFGHKTGMVTFKKK